MIESEFIRSEGSTIQILKMNRPEKLNAVNLEFLIRLREEIELLSKNREVEIVILKSEIAKAFCVGIDVSFVRALSNVDSGEFFELLADTLEKWMELPQLTIAAIEGYAFGFGADLGVACDIRIASSTVQMKFPGPKFGVILGTRHLINEIGYSKAKRLCLLGETLNAQDAKSIGLIHIISSSGNVQETAINNAEGILKIPDFTRSTIINLGKNTTDNNLVNTSPQELAYQSIVNGDFKIRFKGFLNDVAIK